MEMFSVFVMVCCLVGTLRGEPCPEGPSSCATGMTCCLLPSGGKGCCPYANATCCADKVHCCPLGSTCDSNGCRSSLGINSLPAVFINHTSITILKNEVCGDGSQCPDESTCCPMKDGQFGCCPMSDAVCCSDQQHCCPSGMQCDPTGYCHETGASGDVWKTKALKTKALKTKALKTKSVKTSCPGGEAKCPDGNTCCSVGGGDWGCCPMDQAVCCADQQHCCPQGTHCLASGGCAE